MAEKDREVSALRESLVVVTREKERLEKVSIYSIIFVLINSLLLYIFHIILSFIIFYIIFFYMILSFFLYLKFKDPESCNIF